MNKDAAIKVQAATPVKLPKSYSTVENENGNGRNNTCIIPLHMLHKVYIHPHAPGHTRTFWMCNNRKYKIWQI